MRKITLAGVCAALTVSALAHADGTNNYGLVGQLDAVLAYCSQVNPADRTDYSAIRRVLVKWVIGTLPDGVERTQEYRTNYTTTQQQLAQLSRSDGKRECQGGVPKLTDDFDREHGDHGDKGDHNDRDQGAK